MTSAFPLAASVAFARRCGTARSARRSRVAAAPLDDLEDEALAEGGGVELEKFAVLVAVVEDVAAAQAVGEVRLQAEARLDVVVVVRRDLQRLEAVRA